MKRNLFTLVALASCAVAAGAADVNHIDWAKVPAATIPLFYPGQSSHEWVMSDAHKRGAKAVANGRACTDCHDDADQREMGARIVKGGALEPTPIAGKNGTIDLKVQAAFDAQNAYIRYQWKTAQKPTNEYPYYRFDGKAWKAYGGPRLDKEIREGQMPAIYEDRATLMLDDGKVPGFAKQGCWLTCHVGERDMPKEFTDAEIASNPLKTAFKKGDVRKFLPASRSNPDDWKTVKSVEEMAKLKAEGQFVDLIQWRAHRSAPVGMADDGYVLEWRNFDEGKNMFSSNMDAATHQPKMMFDTAKFGAKAITEAEVGKRADVMLLKGQNTVPFDPKAGWKAGDLLPMYVLSAADAKGSAADNHALSSWADGQWTVVLVRPLASGHADDKQLKEGGVYNVGFAVHDNNVTTRGHFVSMVRTLGLGVKADVSAVKLP